MRLQKGFAHILALILIALVVGTLGYFFWKQGITKYKPSSFTLFPTPTPALLDCSDSDSDWKTYLNSYLGFSIKYPDCWEIHTNMYKTDLDKLPYFLLTSKDYKLNIDFGQELYQYRDGSFEKNADHWLGYYLSSTAELGNSNPEVISKETKIIDGVKAIKNIITYRHGDMQKAGITHWIYIPLNRKEMLLSVKYYSRNADEEELELYEKILSTYKFIY